MNLGLGLALELQTMGLTPYQKLLKSATWAIDFSRPQGVKETDVASMNTRQINPIKDLKGTADVTMQQVAWTTADGYATAVAPNGKTVVGFKADGVDTYGVLPSNNAGIDIKGTGDFAYGVVFKTGGTLAPGVFFSFGTGDGTDDLILWQYVNTAMACRINGAFISLGSPPIVINTFYKMLFYRVGGRLKFKVNDVELYNQPNVVNIAQSPIKRLLARATNVDGTTHADFNNNFIGLQMIKNGTFDEAKFIKEWNDTVKQEYGL